ncbi:MAG: NAD-dependent succinate-semialdehyde dehydrogenase [Micrococcales bacterium]|nr:NAD-dependent succinate-semialdehyde dehydrogenase [Micrococcales bacterium]
MSVAPQRIEALLGTTPTGLYIDGAFRPASGGATFAVTNPATGERIADVADGTPDDAMAALDAAVAAGPGWAATPPRVRGETLRRAFDMLVARTEDIALIMTLEMGKPLAEARGEVAYGAEFVRWFSEEAARITGRFGTNPIGTGHAVVSRHPVGPCYLITPWNFPLAMATRKIAPALAAGCTMVVKPAKLTPLTTLAFMQILHEAGVPAGVVNVVPTNSSSSQSAPLLADPRLRKVSFTGSTEIGQVLIRQAAQNVLRTSMELGGNAPFLVFDDADVDAAVTGALAAKFRNIGEACTAANRFIVHESVVAEFSAKVAERVAAMKVGPGTDDGVQIGALIDDAAVNNCARLVADAVGRGAQVLAGGKAPEGPGCFFEPTVLGGVPADALVMVEEIFGPVLPITTFADEADGIALANTTEYGLAAYAYTQDLNRATRLIDALECGLLGLNTGVVSDASQPFGGVKQSGLGREGGREGIEEYLTTKYTLVLG